MKKVKQQIIEIRPRVVFEVSNRTDHHAAADPTTSLGATTFTGILTVLETVVPFQSPLRK